MRHIRSARRTPTTGACTTHWGMSGSGVKTSGPRITTRRKKPAPRAASAPRVIRGGSWVSVAQVRARGVPQPLRALGPGPRPGLSLCRVQGSGTGRSEQESGASGGARRSGCGAPRRPRPGERSGLDQRRCGGNGCRGVRDAATGLRAFGRRASHAAYDVPLPPGLPPSVGTSMGSGRSSRSRDKPGSHPRNARPRRRTPRREFNPHPSASASDGSRRGGS